LFDPRKVNAMALFEWFVKVMHDRPEVAFFFTITIGYALGRIRVGSFTLGAVTGVLLAGVLVGQFGITLPTALKQVFFLLFLFSIGYRTGPQFFRGLRKDGLAQAALAVVFSVVGLAVAYAFSRLAGYEAGTAAGLIAGSLTESATIGTAGDAISNLSISKEAQTHLTNQIPVAFAVTYLVGVIMAAWFLAQVGPRLLGVDLAAECKAYEEEMSGGERLDAFPALRIFDIRTFRIDPDSALIGLTVREVESPIAGGRFHIDRVRRSQDVVSPGPEYVLKTGDVIAIAGRHELIVERGHVFGTEVADRDLAQATIDVVDVVVTQKSVDGTTLADLAARPFANGVFLRSINRSGVTIPVAPATIVQRGDVLSIVGKPERTKEAVKAIGVADRVSDVTDMFFVGLGIFVGALVGIPALRFGALELGLSESVGVLLGGLVFGWLRSLRPIFVRIPSPTLWLFESLGLTGFVAVVGLSAGPDFVRGLQESGLTLVLAALLVVVSAQFVTLMVGKYLFHMHPGILLGACAGAGTATPALAAVQEVAKSAVPTLGYGVSYAVGNVLLALWGTVIVFLLR
jgi:putative transport protein